MHLLSKAEEVMYKIENLPKWKLAYIAGILDGEGCISLIRTHHQRSISPSVKVGMTNIMCINMLCGTAGMGRVSTVVYQKKSTNRMYHCWSVCGRLEIYLLLKAVLPYLIVKGEHAGVMMEFVERRISDVKLGGYDEELRRKLTDLNK